MKRLTLRKFLRMRYLSFKGGKTLEELWISLPALAPDYSGVCSAMFDLGGMSVIHDASGCTGNYTGYDEPRWYGSNSMVYCSGLREIDAVLGRDDKLIANILKTAEYTNPRCFSLIGSPVPMVIGSDMKGIAKELENSTGIPSFGFSTNGLGLYNKGVSEAVLTVIKRFLKPSAEKLDRSINVIGTTPLDFSANSNAEDLYKALGDHGYKVIGKLMMGASIEQIENLTMAQVNLVVTESGLDAAIYLYKEYGIPYVVGMLTGNDNELFELIEKTRADKKCRVLGITEPESTGSKKESPQDISLNDTLEKVFIVGEQVLGNSIRYAINRRCPQIPVVVGTMTGLRKEIAKECDLDIPGEESLVKLMESGNYRVIVGDPLLGDVLTDDLKLVEMPHVALSSKLYWNKAVHFIGREMDDIVKKVISFYDSDK